MCILNWNPFCYINLIGLLLKSATLQCLLTQDWFPWLQCTSMQSLNWSLSSWLHCVCVCSWKLVPSSLRFYQCTTRYSSPLFQHAKPDETLYVTTSTAKTNVWWSGGCPHSVPNTVWSPSSHSLMSNPAYLLDLHICKWTIFSISDQINIQHSILPG